MTHVTGNELSRWLVNLLGHLGHDTPSKRASVMGWTQPMETNFESGTKFPEQSRLEGVLKKLNVSAEDVADAVLMLKRAKAARREELRELAVNTESSHVIPIWTRITAKAKITAETAHRVGSTLVTQEESEQRVFAMEAQDDAMKGSEKPIASGDVVIAAASECVPPASGEKCVVQVDDDEWIVRRVILIGHNRVILKADNPEYKPIEIDTKLQAFIIHGVVLRSITVHKVMLSFQTVPAKITGRKPE